MMLFKVELIVFLSLCVQLIFGSEKCDKAIHKAGVIPRVFQTCNSTDLQVIYGRKKIKCGRDFPITSAVYSPHIIFTHQAQCENVTFLMYGPTIRQVLEKALPFFMSNEPSNVGIAHWLIHNIPSSALLGGFYGKKGDVKYPYLTPLAFSGSHKYNFFVFCQQRYIPTKKVNYLFSLFERLNFHVRKLQVENGLGDPIACNFLKLVF